MIDGWCAWRNVMLKSNSLSNLDMKGLGSSSDLHLPVSSTEPDPSKTESGTRKEVSAETGLANVR